MSHKIDLIRLFICQETQPRQEPRRQRPTSARASESSLSAHIMSVRLLRLLGPGVFFNGLLDLMCHIALVFAENI